MLERATVVLLQTGPFDDGLVVTATWAELGERAKDARAVSAAGDHESRFRVCRR